MNTSLTAAIVCACLFATGLAGMWIRRFLPEHHLSADTRDTVKLAMGLVSWLAVIFLSFSLRAPPNATANLALIVSALSVAGAIFLILGLDRPFGGLIQISPVPMQNALIQLAP
jgi:NADH:ubiquinone oxidoreductase subunit 4 (subunit M)